MYHSFLIHSSVDGHHLCLFTEAFSILTFKIIIGMYVLIAMFSVVLGFFSVGLSFFIFLVISCDSMAIISVMFKCNFMCLCV